MWIFLKFTRKDKSSLLGNIKILYVYIHLKNIHKKCWKVGLSGRRHNCLLMNNQSLTAWNWNQYCGPCPFCWSLHNRHCESPLSVKIICPKEWLGTYIIIHYYILFIASIGLFSSFLKTLRQFNSSFDLQYNNWYRFSNTYSGPPN